MSEFILTSAKTIELRDSLTDVLLSTSETITDNTISQSVSAQEIRGGEFNKKLMEYSTDKNVSCTLTDAEFNSEYLAFNQGDTFVNGAQDVYTSQQVVLVADNGTLSETPVGNIYVKRANGAIQTITPTGDTFVVAGAGSESVDVRFRTSRSVDTLAIGSSTFPGTYRLVIIERIFSSEKGQGEEVGTLTTIVPYWKVTGNSEMSFASASPLTSTLEGNALNYTDPETGKDVYGYYQLDYTTSGGVADQIIQIAATPSAPILDISDGDTVQIQVIGIRGNGKTNVANPDGTTFSSATPATATVSVDGLITPVADGVVLITVTNGVLTDVISVTVQA